jgi:fibronectin-binding autotransporter adhesin
MSRQLVDLLRTTALSAVVGLAAFTATPELAQISSSGNVNSLVPGSGLQVDNDGRVFVGVGGAAGTVDVNNNDASGVILRLNDNPPGQTSTRFFVGTDNGEGTLNITNGGKVELNANGGGGASMRLSDVIFGGTVSQNGTLNMDNGSLTIDAFNATGNSYLEIGRQGFGQATAVNGSFIDIVAEGTGAAEAGIQIGGTGSTATNDSLGTFSVDSSFVGVTTLSQDSGTAAFINIGRNTMNLTPGTNVMQVVNGGTVVVSAPDAASSVINVGRSGAVAELTVDGAGSSVSAEDLLNIGRDGGTGTVNVQIAGTVIIQGQDGIVRVGRDGGTGTLNVNTGGTLNTTRVQIGMNSAGGSGVLGSSGVMNVDGVGTVVNVTGVDPNSGIGAGFSVGREEIGVLNVTNGGVIVIDDGAALTRSNSRGLAAGGAANSTSTVADGTINVDGAGSRIDVNGDLNNIAIGRTGTGVLNITNGGVVSANGADNYGFVGRKATGDGTVNVTGTGSVLNTGANLLIGADFDFGLNQVVAGGTGVVNVANGGTVQAGAILVGAGGTLTGGGGSVVGNVTNEGTLAAGNSPGIMTVQGDLTLTALGLTQIELGGTALGQFDQINVFDNLLTGALEGNLDIAGTLDVSFFGGFVAGLGDAFDVFTAETIDLLAPIWNLPTLSFGLDWDIAVVDAGAGRSALCLSVVEDTGSAVPVPMSGLLLAAGLVLLRRAHRRA